MSIDTTHGICKTSDGRLIELHSRVASGGEGSVYHVGGDQTLVAKLYKPSTTAEEKRIKGIKLKKLIEVRPDFASEVSAWPMDLLFDENGNICGFLMEHLQGFQPLFTAYQLKSRQKQLKGRDFGFLVRVARNLAACVHNVHSAGLVIGDLNESNVLVTPGAKVRLIDVDSFQIATDEGILPPNVGKAELTAPELQNKSLEGVIRTEIEDRFSLGILIFQTLVFGRHPFAGRRKDENDIELETAIANGWYAYGDDRDCPLEPPRHVDISYLPDSIQQMFVRAFVPGNERPSAEDWHQQLLSLESDLVTCPQSTAHQHHKDTEGCPWCKFEERWNVSLFASESVVVEQRELPDYAKVKEALEAIPEPVLMEALPSVESSLKEPVAMSWWDWLRFTVLGNIVITALIFTLGSGTIYLLAVNFGRTNSFFHPVVFFIVPSFLSWLRSMPSKLPKLKGGFEALMDSWNRTADLSLFAQKREEILNSMTDISILEINRENLRMKAMRKHHEPELRSYLSRYSIAIADVPPGYRESIDNLIDRGIRTAADVNETVLRGMVVRNKELTESLMVWVRSLELQFWESGAIELTASETAEVDAEINARRDLLCRRLENGHIELEAFGRQLQRNQETLMREYDKIAPEYATLLAKATPEMIKALEEKKD